MIDDIDYIVPSLEDLSPSRNPDYTKLSFATEEDKEKLVDLFRSHFRLKNMDIGFSDDGEFVFVPSESIPILNDLKIIIFNPS